MGQAAECFSFTISVAYLTLDQERLMKSLYGFLQLPEPQESIAEKM
jgi:hypothetical protein